MKYALSILLLTLTPSFLAQAQQDVISIHPPTIKKTLIKGPQQPPEAFLALAATYPQPELITTLDLRNCNLQEVPVWLQRYGNLTTLILRNNPIRRLPFWLSNLSRLHTLSFSQLPTASRMRSPALPIEVLTVAESDLSRIPRWVRHHKQLKELYLEKNRLSRVRRRLPKTLSVLDLSENPLQLKKQRAKKLAGLRALLLNSCALNSLPTTLWPDMPNLERLQIAGNQLKSLPETLLDLQQLKELSLYKNQLSQLPDSLGKLSRLQLLDLYFNDIRYLPESLGQLDSLQVLFVSHNQLIELPESIGKLQELKELYAHHNKLTYLPASLGQLQKLEVLRLNRNALQEFPLAVLQFPALKELDLAFNQIRTLPEQLLSYPPKRELSLQENPLNIASLQILERLKGKLELLNY